jgi:hypothetical protein
MSFTFKKQPKETGLSAVGNPYPDTDVKYHKKVVGYIAAPNWMSKSLIWKIRFRRKEEKDGQFSWITIKQQFDSEPAAREWIKTNAEKIIALGLYPEED